jgi:hypothetical protein
LVLVLGQITLSMLEGLSVSNIATSKRAQKNNPSYLLDISIKDIEKVNLFGLIRMLEATIVNIHRIHIFWDFLVN